MPAGSSSLQFAHYGQHIRNGKFTKFDHGNLNYFYYGRSTPPEYDLHKFNIPIALHYSDNDALSRSIDVFQLRPYFPKIIGWYKVPSNKFGHFDFVMGTNARELVYKRLGKIASLYS